MSVDTRTAAASTPAPTPRRGRSSRLVLLLVLLGFFALGVTRFASGQEVMSNAGTASAMLVLALPIALAGLGGLVAERAGIVNIGLEGMMILGTWGAGWAGYQWGPWAALLAAIGFGAIGGLVHAVATVTFGVDHIVSGVAINLLAAGFVRFLSEVSFAGVSGGGATQSPTISSDVPSFTVPALASGPDLLGRLADTGIVGVADLAGVSRGLLSGVTVFQLLALSLFPLVFLLLWRTPLGLRWRSSGEAPLAAETLGVNVLRIRYLAVVLSGALAGLGGLFLVTFVGRYSEGQTGGRGYIGLAAMIFGNWRPGGLLLGSSLFGYSDALRLRAPDSGAVLALLLLVALVLAGVAVHLLRGGRRRLAGISLGFAAGALVSWLLLDTLPGELVAVTPYIVTLVVLAASSQRLRPPAAAGLPYRRGEE